MSKGVSAGRSRKRAGRKSSSAVAGAGNVRATGCASQCIDVTAASASRERSWGHARRAGQQRRRQRDERHWTVVSDPGGSPCTITSAELDVIETYLGNLLDELFAECHGTA
jgi:hypothetical protein